MVALEHPDVRCVRVDLDPAGRAEDVQALCDEIRWSDGEDQVAFRDGERRVSRLVRCSSKPFAVRRDRESS